MSTAIALMNKHAVALASDGAYSPGFWGDDGQWSFEGSGTYKNIFKISDTLPVGIIQYFDPFFMRVPFETVFTSYKNHLGKTRFNTLKEYVDDFIHFLVGNRTLFPIKAQDSVLREMVYECFQEIAKEVRDAPQAEFEVTIDNHIRSLSTAKQSDGFPETFVPELVEHKRELLDEIAESVVEKSLLSGSILDSLRQVGGHFVARAIEGSDLTGVAFVGYGEKEIFPRLIGLNIKGVIDGFLQYWQMAYEKLSSKYTPLAFGFGEDEMIPTFFKGVKQTYYDSAKRLRDGMKSSFTGEQKGSAIDPPDKFLMELDSLINDSKIRNETLIKSFSSLPQSDLAQAAEGMLKLERLNLKLLDRQESTDEVALVALITKKRFSWVKKLEWC